MLRTLSWVSWLVMGIDRLLRFKVWGEDWKVGRLEGWEVWLLLQPATLPILPSLLVLAGWKLGQDVSLPAFQSSARSVPLFQFDRSYLFAHLQHRPLQRQPGQVAGRNIGQFGGQMGGAGG